MNDLKISHVDSKEVTRMLCWLEGRCGKLRTTRGKLHDDLGMTLDFSKKGKVKVLMVEYVNEIIEDFPEAVEGSVTTTAAEHLFNIKKEGTALNETQVRQFHTFTAKLLFVCKRARPDIQMAVAFLTTRVKNPDEDDWKKPRRLILYLNGTRELSLTLSAEHLTVPTWWIDSAFAIHPDMRGHTGVTMLFGKGSLSNWSMKQQLNTKSSTKTELITVDDMMPHVLWTKYFLQAQGYSVKTATIYQDNLSAMLLEKNGKWIEQHKERLNWSTGTEEMVADFFTKPLQGALFRKFRELILNTEC
eukprot:15365980-Ditylum_brightwellii.AAC.1